MNWRVLCVYMCVIERVRESLHTSIQLTHMWGMYLRCVRWLKAEHWRKPLSGALSRHWTTTTTHTDAPSLLSGDSGRHVGCCWWFLTCRRRSRRMKKVISWHVTRRESTWGRDRTTKWSFWRQVLPWSQSIVLKTYTTALVKTFNSKYLCCFQLKILFEEYCKISFL